MHRWEMQKRKGVLHKSYNCSKEEKNLFLEKLFFTFGNTEIADIKQNRSTINFLILTFH